MAFGIEVGKKVTMCKTIIFLGIWLAFLTGCASLAGNELVGTETAVTPITFRPPAPTSVPTTVPTSVPTTAPTPMPPAFWYGVDASFLPS